MSIRHPLRRRRKKGDTAQLAAQLAPLEEQDARAARAQGANGRGQNGGGLVQEHGALIVNTDHLHLPSEFTESGKGRFWQIEPVVLVIVFAMLLFTVFIAWQIREMKAAEARTAAEEQIRKDEVKTGK